MEKEREEKKKEARNEIRVEGRQKGGKWMRENSKWKGERERYEE